MRLRHYGYSVCLSILAMLATAVVALPQGAPPGAVQDGTAVLLEVTGPIGPATSDYIKRGLDRAAEAAADVAILRLDTPGGLDTSMREIVETILAAPMPVIGFVAPSGARAASAGTYILYACHVAAMAPGTNLGAATPIQIGGRSPLPLPVGEDEPTDDTETGDGEDGDAPSGAGRPTLEDKAINDAVAYIRSLAQLRGRNEEWAARAVSEAASLPAADALDSNVIDLIADDVADLLAAIHGRTIDFGGEPRPLMTRGLTVRPMEPDWRTKLLATITNPNVAYILMLIGIYGLILEFYNPGSIAPGTIGTISLLLALYAFHVLPVDFVGAALLVLGLALIAAELFAPGLGVLGIGGMVSFVIGSVMLIETDAPGFSVSWQLIGPMAALGGAAILGTGLLLMRSRQRPAVTGQEEMLGSAGRVIEWSDGEGTIRVHGEVWRARAARPTEPGSAVRVVAIDGLILTVEPDTSRRRETQT